MSVGASATTQGYSIVLEDAAGNRHTVGDIQSIDPVREVEALSDWEATTYYNESLEDWCFSEAYIYYNGGFLFRGYLERVESDKGSNQTTLEGRGKGRDLVKGSNATASVRYQNEFVHDAWQDYLNNHCSIGGTVTAPTPNTVTGQGVMALSTDSEFTNALESAITSSDAFEVSSGVKPLQAGYFTEAEDADVGGILVSVDEMSGGQGASVDDISEDLEWTFTTEYDIPANDFEVRFRSESVLDEPDYRVYLDGEILLERLAGGSRALAWTNAGSPSSDVTAGSHTVAFRVEDVNADGTADAGDLTVDCIWAGDSSYSWTFDNTVDANKALTGPGLYPPGVPVVFEERSAGYRITDGHLTATMDDTGDGQALAQSVDGGSTWREEANTSSQDEAWVDLTTTTIQPRVKVGSQADGRTTTPTQNNSPQTLSELTLTIDGDDQGVMEDQEFTGTHLDNHQKFADLGGMTFVILHGEADADVKIDAFREKTATADWVLLNPVRTVDVYGYANSITGRGAKPDDTTGIPSENLDNGRLVATITNEAEVTAKGETVGDSFTDPSLTTLDDLRSAIRTELGVAVEEDELTGTLEIVPTLIDPGYTYTVDEWGEDLQLQSVSYSESLGEGSGTLSFDREEGIAGEVSGLKNRTRKVEGEL